MAVDYHRYSNELRSEKKHMNAIWHVNVPPIQVVWLLKTSPRQLSHIKKEYYCLFSLIAALWVSSIFSAVAAYRFPAIAIAANAIKIEKGLVYQKRRLYQYYIRYNGF